MKRHGKVQISVLFFVSFDIGNDFKLQSNNCTNQLNEFQLKLIGIGATSQLLPKYSFKRAEFTKNGLQLLTYIGFTFQTS